MVLSKFLETDLFPVQPWPAPSAMLWGGHKQVSDGIAFGPGYELMPVGEQLSDELAAGVVGICFEQNLAFQKVGDGEQQRRQLIEQGSGIAIGKNQSFVDPGCQGYSGRMPGRSLHQQRNGLKRMVHDVYRFGIASR